jgi:gliding motility-associated-like protein
LVTTLLKYTFLLFVLISSVLTTKAQLCGGTKGDTAVYNDFTRGRWYGDVESAPIKGMLPLFTHRTDYFCPPDYSYCITNHSYGCNNGSWHDVPEDHTPNDVLGRFWLIAGTTTPEAFYKDTFNALKGSTNYELSFWFLNMYRKYSPPLCIHIGSPVKPDLTIIAETLSGTELARFRTGPLEETATVAWKQIALSFSMPAGQTSVVIRMENNASGICGNDFAIDDWLIQECIPSAVKAGFNLAGVQGDTARLCVSSPTAVSISEKSTPLYNNTVYQWQETKDNGLSWTDIPGASTNTYTNTFSTAGTNLYRLAVSDPTCNNKPNCVITSNTIVLILSPGANYSVTSNSPVCTGKDITLNITNTSNSSTYKWNGPNGFTATGATVTVANASATMSGKYFLEINTNNGQCIQNDSVVVSVNPIPSVNAGPDVTITAGATAQLKGSSATPGAIYSWTPVQYIDNPTVPNPTVNPPEETAYTLSVTTPGGGCGTASDKVIVTVLGEVVIPNTFTPNGDGINDSWQIKGLSAYSNCRVSVYNRYGQLLFSQKGYSVPWNGMYNNTNLPIGTYYYIITGGSLPQKLSGSLTILR